MHSEILHVITHSMIHSFKDSLHLLPFLFLTYLFMEFFEHKMDQKMKQSLMKSEKAGPVLGALLGLLPQCGFSAAASNLYAGRVITMGTLIAVYLSTSDEMLPIMISEAVPVKEIAVILGCKMVIGLIAGLAIDFFLYGIKKKELEKPTIHEFCEHENCHCGDGILKPALFHTVKIWAFIFVISVALHLTIELVGLEKLSNSILGYPVIGVLISGLVGLIPNCAASVLITKLYLSTVIPFGTMMAGLLVSAGVGILVLLRVNHNRKESFAIIGILYLIGVFCGGIMNFFM